MAPAACPSYLVFNGTARVSTGPRLFLNLSVSITRGIWKIIPVASSSTALCGRAVYNLNARGQPGHRKAGLAGLVHLLLCTYLAHVLELSGGGAMSGKGPSCLTHKAAHGGLTLNRVARQQRWLRKHRLVPPSV